MNFVETAQIDKEQSERLNTKPTMTYEKRKVC